MWSLRIPYTPLPQLHQTVSPHSWTLTLHVLHPSHNTHTIQDAGHLSTPGWIFRIWKTQTKLDIATCWKPMRWGAMACSELTGGNYYLSHYLSTHTLGKSDQAFKHAYSGPCCKSNRRSRLSFKTIKPASYSNQQNKEKLYPTLVDEKKNCYVSSWKETDGLLKAGLQLIKYHSIWGHRRGQYDKAAWSQTTQRFHAGQRVTTRRQ